MVCQNQNLVLIESYFSVVEKINKLVAVDDNDKWIKAISAQMQDLVKRAASAKCEERRMTKLVHHWESYLVEKSNKKA